MAINHLIANPRSIGPEFWQGRDDAAAQAQLQNRNALLQREMGLREQEFSAGQKARVDARQLQEKVGMFRAADSNPAVKAALIAEMRADLPQLAQMDDESLFTLGLERTFAVAGVDPQVASEPYSISQQPGPFGSIIVTDGRRMQVVEPPRPAAGPGPVAPPASIAEWQAYQSMTPEQQAAYLNMKRSNATPEMAGEITRSRKQAEADVELATNEPKATVKDAVVSANVANVITTIDEALALTKARGTTGIAGKVSRGVTQATGATTPAYDLSQKLLTIKANLGFDRLQAMRDASPTGGALGQVAVQELEALQASVASLDTAQSKEQIQAALGRIKQHYGNWQKIMDQAAKQRKAKVSGGADSGTTVDFGDLPE